MEEILIKIDFYTKKNSKDYSKPNEDYIHVVNDMGIFILLDGVSRDLEHGIYPSPSPSLAVSELFAIKTARYLTDELTNNDTIPLATIKNAIEYGNRNIRAYNDDLGHCFLPGTVGIISCIVDSTFYYGYIGDCIGMYNLTTFTTSQTERIRASKHKYTPEEIRTNICNNLKHPCSYGVLNGQREALAFVKYGSFKIAQGDSLVMMTDGMESVFTLCDVEDLHKYKCYELVDIVEANERNSSASDDKSILRVTI